MQLDKRPIRIHATLVPKLNLAFYQNSVPTILELAIINESEDSLTDVELSLTSDPVFFKPKTWRIDLIDTNQHCRLPDLDILLDNALLARLTEAETSQVTFVLNANGEEITRLSVSIELLARNQWGGIDHMPEIIAAFVQPNEPAVEHLLKKAAEILRKYGKSSALNGYEGGPKRAWDLISAIWSAIGSIGLDYSLPPASFERTGQKIRSSGKITDVGIATCLDVALFFCAAIEQCGLNPLLVFTRGHVFAGVWLKAEEFTTVIVDDITALRKRVKLKELVLFETVLVTQHPCPGFGRAVELGAKQISEDVEEKFELAVDVQRARLQRIKPLASEHVVPPSITTVEPIDGLGPIFEEAPDLPDDEIIRQDEPATAKPKDRLDQWQRKLLDLTLRNSLLNFRTTKRAIKFCASDPSRIEDMLADGHALKLFHRPELMDGKDLRNQAIYEARTNEDIHRAHALDALNRKEVMVHLSKEELDSRLIELYRFARASLNEGGANTLFLAIGFLSWTRNTKDDKRYRAPLILLPVTLHRKSVRSGFSLRILDDEPRFNPTLIEMLHQDFRIKLPVTQNELPKDDHGLDITAIWHMVEQEIKDIAGWEVIEDVVLSTFSFAKYLMWKDLVDRTDQLKQSPVVKHLMDTPRDPYLSEIDFPNPQTLDSNHDPVNIFCPLPADSSQLSAVIAAANGKDFVLIGPPGTGKSQTIANLIAQCIAEQKTVLFVSEKMAALNVVYRRLEEIGLGDFCLELHSNKARKLEILEKLQKSWNAKGEVDAAEWQKEAQRLKEIRNQLNKYVKHLHRQHHNGLTAYTAIGLIAFGSDLPKLGLSWPTADVHSEDDLFALERLVEEVQVNAKEVGGISDSHLAIISHYEWSPNWQQSMVKAARDLASSTETLKKSAATFLKAASLPEIILDSRGREGLASLSEVLPKAAGRDWRFTLRPDVRSICEDLQEGLDLLIQHQKTKDQLPAPWSLVLKNKIKHGLDLIKSYRDISSQLSAPYESKGSELDAEKLKIDWDKAEQSWWPLKWIRSRRVRSTLDEVIEGKHKIDVPGDIERLIILHRFVSEINDLANLSLETANLWGGLETRTDYLLSGLAFQESLSSSLAGKGWSEEGLEAVAGGLCGAEMSAGLENLKYMKVLEEKISKFEHLQTKTNDLWLGLNTRTDEVEKALTFMESISTNISQIAPTAESLSNIKVSLVRLLGDSNALLEPSGPLPSEGSRYRAAFKHFQSAIDTLAAVASESSSEVIVNEDDIPDIISELCRGILQLEPKLHAWCAWRKVRREAVTRGLMPLVKAIESGDIELSKVKEVFKTDYAQWWLNSVVEGDDVLCSFVSASHEKCIQDFRALDDKFTKLTREYVRAGLCANLPDDNDSSKSSEWGLLRREMQKKRQHLPMRELMNRVPSAITKLAPCLMMSPLSIAQYLSTDTALFDVVVFDEASQIPVWDAMGAIARGKQVVMVGDPKQLPPTSFFDRAEADGDENADVESDLESILDECLGANLPTMNLSWHYRSRHESLIAFSNNRYYGGGLVTFPSPNTDDQAVSFHYINDGIYEKGGARINKKEAHALVGHIVARLKDQEFRASKLTIGVVTFNSEQQRLIENLFDDERRKDPSIECFFDENAIEAIFVKNLESVQGDERDIMYFSIGYGPDLTGAISMNFGPMNRDGGERRLNVAITRARHELLVFSSLKPEQIDLSRTQAIGVRDLKHFMEFAERGPKALAEAVFGTIGDYDSPFEQAVADALINKEWQVHPQVGVSAFRIDLGIVNPDAPGQYLAGIECDGATYHRSATARDRDKVREQVLRGLGWEIVRIWSTDWWIDAVGTLEKVDSKLKVLLEKSRARRAEDEAKLEKVAKSVEQTGLKEETSADPEIADTLEHTENLLAGESLDSLHSSPVAYIGAGDQEVASGLRLTSTQYKDQQDTTNLQLNSDSARASSQGEALDTVFLPYKICDDSTWSDPRSADIDDISEGLYQIIEGEGPMLAKRAYDIYLRGCGIKRMGHELKKIMNRALHNLTQKKRILAEDELNKKGLMYTFVRTAGTPHIILRERGPRKFEEIPPSEIMVANHLITKNTSFQKGSDSHLHAILKKFNLKRLTTPTGTRLLEILEMEFDYVFEWLNKHGLND